jgi:hypothetical protein
MSVKPTLANARWATDLSNNTAPSSGQRDTGWTANQAAVSSYFNALGYEAYKWFEYLDDGDLDLGSGDIIGHGTRTIWAIGGEFQPSSETIAYTRTGLLQNTTGLQTYCRGLFLPANARLTSLEVDIQTSSTAGTRTLACSEFFWGDSPGLGSIGTNDTTTTISSYETLVLAGLPATHENGPFVAQVAVTTGDYILGMRYSYDLIAP